MGLLDFFFLSFFLSFLWPLPSAEIIAVPWFNDPSRPLFGI